MEPTASSAPARPARPVRAAVPLWVIVLTIVVLQAAVVVAGPWFIG